MASYHINSKGEPGKCRAFSGNCPFGNEDAHFRSESAAYEAIAKEAGGAFQRKEEIVVKRKDRLEVATNSRNPKELMALASGLGEFGSSRRAAAALAKNPAATADVLKEARSKASLAFHEFVDLEQHPNYPLDALTGEGATRLMDTASKDKLMELAKRNDVGDVFLDHATFNKDHAEIIQIGLRNPDNKLSEREIGSLAMKDPSNQQAAAESGRWPTKGDINGKNTYYTNETYSTGNGWDTRRGTFGADDLVAAARHTPNEETVKQLVSRFGNTPNGIYLYNNIVKNPNFSDEFKKEFASEISANVSQIQSILDDLK